MLDLFVLDAASGAKVPAFVEEATEADLAATDGWQTNLLHATGERKKCIWKLKGSFCPCGADFFRGGV